MDDSSESSPAISRRTVLGMVATSVAVAGLAACDRPDKDGSDGGAVTGESAAIARDAYIFGYPLVLMDFTREASEATTPSNQFQHATTLPTPESRSLVRQSLDLMYSTAWLDLRAEPMVLQVPAMDGRRYWLMQLLDAWTNTVHNPSSIRPQATSAEPPFTYVVTGPDWSGALPEDLAPMPMPTSTVWLLGLIQVDGNAGIPAVRAVQQQLKLVPLSVWIAGRELAGPAAPPSPETAPKPPPEQVDALDPREFFDRMCAVMSVNTPAPDDAPAMRRFAMIGIRPGGSVSGLSDDELVAAVDTAKQQIPVYLDPKAINENGWAYDPGIGSYGTNYLLRASIAWRGLGAAQAEDAIYPTQFVTVDQGDGEARFRLHFAPGALPPVEAFWSLTAYDVDSYLVPNPAQIHSVGHQAPVVLNPDGSLDLTLQFSDPGPSVPVGNWLPIPEAGEFSLTMRLYAPKAEAVQGRWVPPPLTPLP
ncbi:DUF1254 domain-containing protein [Nocardia sp. NPDC049220]|uniref:DUF1254 domain-containing protein n=1 Tax=Nocardia sp. NPDC049220 TaxID=3155273 RepID=UPI0033E6AED3